MISKRDSKGRFIKDISGNPVGATRVAITQRLLKDVPIQDVDKIRKSLFTQAQKGNLQAIKLFLQYFTKPPVQQTEQTIEEVKRSPEDIRKEFISKFKKEGK